MLRPAAQLERGDIRCALFIERATMDDPDFPKRSDSPDETPAVGSSEASEKATPTADGRPSDQTASATTAAEPSLPRVATLPIVKGRYGVCLVLLMVALADVTIYHTRGFTGLSVFLAGASVLLCCGVPSRALKACTYVVWSMLAVSAWRLADCGNNVLLLCGFWLLLALVVSLEIARGWVAR